MSLNFSAGELKNQTRRLKCLRFLRTDSILFKNNLHPDAKLIDAVMQHYFGDPHKLRGLRLIAKEFFQRFYDDHPFHF